MGGHLPFLSDVSPLDGSLRVCFIKSSLVDSTYTQECLDFNATYPCVPDLDGLVKSSSGEETRGHRREGEAAERLVVGLGLAQGRPGLTHVEHLRRDG